MGIYAPGRQVLTYRPQIVGRVRICGGRLSKAKACGGNNALASIALLERREHHCSCADHGGTAQIVPATRNAHSRRCRRKASPLARAALSSLCGGVHCPETRPPTVRQMGATVRKQRMTKNHSTYRISKKASSVSVYVPHDHGTRVFLFEFYCTVSFTEVHITCTRECSQRLQSPGKSANQIRRFVNKSAVPTKNNKT